MNRFRRLLLIAAINDYDPFPAPLFSADLRAYVYIDIYIDIRETMARALRSGRTKLERERRPTMAKNVHTRAGKTGDVV